MWAKGCPKCGGDLCLREDQYGKFLNCLQCGYLKDLLADSPNNNLIISEAPVKAPAKKPVKKPLVAAGLRKAA
jgi:DNA-directed RNA polymerase subunit M/transcription elongation factor TFIIS